MSLQGGDRWIPWLLFSAAFAVLFFNLGDAALFEPDEGRNAEKARGILILHDWVTPHENFYPVIDKPVFLYWLIAIAYQFFGVSEWAARLPSALAAFGCVGVIYYFVRRHWGQWQALWSVLILLGSIKFFILARVVIFDMPLTFFLTLALCAFYEAAHTNHLGRRRFWCMVMYGSLGAATLIKGLIGVVLAGMIIFFYLLISRRWTILRSIYFIPGAILFGAMVAPWYLQMEGLYPGYLKYFFWDEHFGRFTGRDFNRGEPWYFFILVGLIGFFPWTLVLPFAVTQYGRNHWDDKTRFLILWTALPFLFFSASNAKLPHYILPIFPPLAVLTGAALVHLYQKSPSQLSFALSLTAVGNALNALYLVIGSLWPMILPRALRGSIQDMVYFLWIYCGLIVVLLAVLVYRQVWRPWPTQRQLYLVHGLSMVIFLVLVARLMVLTAPERSARELAEIVAQQAEPSTRLVFYDTYLSSMAFYLRTERPIWMVTHSDKKKTFLGNFYAKTDRDWPVTHWGKAILDFEEFQEKWQTVREPMLIIVKDKNRPRLEEQIGARPEKVAAVDEYLLLLKP